MAGVHGAMTKLCFGDALPASPLHIDFQSDTIGLTQATIDGNGLKGTRSRYTQRARRGIKRVGGNVTWTPTAVDLNYVLPKILGSAGVGNLAETLPTFQAWAMRGTTGATSLFQYAGLGVTQATLSGRSGELINLSLDLVGQTETQANVSAYPAGTIDLTTPPFLFHEGEMFLSGTTQFSEFTLTVNNAIDAERFLNSISLVSVQPTDRIITFSVTVPFGDYPALYPPALDPAGTGTQVILTFTSGAVSMAINLYAVQFEPVTPVVNGRGEVVMILSGTARRDAVNSEMYVALDAAP